MTKQNDTLFYCLFFVGFFSESHGNTIQITLSILSDSTATVEKSQSLHSDNASQNLPLLVLFQDTDLFQRLENLTVDGARGINVVRRTRATVDSTTVNLVQGTNTNVLTDVDVTSNGGYDESLDIIH